MNKEVKEIVVDANVVIKWAVPEPMHEEAKALLNSWLETETVIFAPTSLILEVDSALRKKATVFKEITLEKSRQAWSDIQEVTMNFIDLTSLRQRAWEISIEFNHSGVYDSVYLAAAENKGCSFWTADERLYNSVKKRFSFVKWLGDYTIAF